MFRERSLAGEVGPGCGQVLLVLLPHPFPGGLQVGDDIGLGAAVTEVDLHQLLELEHRTRSGFLHPRGQLPPALGGDGVAGATPPTDRIIGRRRVPVGNKLLGFLVELALGPRPEPPAAAVDLLHMTAPEEVKIDPANRNQLHAWDGDEGAYWADHADHFDRAVAPYHRRLLDAAAITAAARVLDIGCWTGQTTRDAARSAAQGSALGGDLSARMLDLARRRATEEGVTNATFDQVDAQIHPFPSEGFWDLTITGPSSRMVIVARSSVRLHALSAGSMTLSRGGFPEGEVGEITYPVVVYLIEHPGALVVVDTGVRLP